MPPRVRVDHLYKIFGGSPDEAVRRFESGMTKEEIHSQSGNVLAVADVSFSVETGEVFMVMGLSGSGKSTLVRCLNRLIEPTSGNVYVDEDSMMAYTEDQLRELRRTRMSMVFQHFGLLPHRTVVENVEYGLKVRGMARDERRKQALKALENVGLGGWGSYYPHNLSGGMQQRVGLARGLVTDPDILLMDEAFSALDPLIRREMQDELMALQRTVKKTIIFITHDLHEALRMGDRIAIMKDGFIVQTGTPQEIVATPGDEYVRSFTEDVDRSKVFTVGDVMRPPATVTASQMSRSEAISRMQEHGQRALYVVERHAQHTGCAGRPVGVVTEADLARAADGSGADMTTLVRKEFPQASPSAYLADVYPLAASGMPIAIADERGCLVGMVEQADLFERLAAGNYQGSSAGSRQVAGALE